MVPFAGYNMPVEYKGINEEHNMVRESAGVFDVSHMGEIWLRDPMRCLLYNIPHQMTYRFCFGQSAVLLLP